MPQYTRLYVTSRSIKMLARFPLYLSFPFSPSVRLSLSLSSTCAQQPIHLMQFPPAIFIPATSHPISFCLSFPVSLSLPRCTGDVILFQLDSPPFSLLPPARALLRFPLAAGSPKAQHLSVVASFHVWEGEEECRREV